MATNSGGSTSAAERAYQLIRAQILTGTHLPGTMLGETGLAADLQVSRTPVRVALARLQDEGWIIIYPKRGAIVQGVDERTVAELADARFVLETTAVDRAPDALRQKLADGLDHSIEAQREAFDSGDITAFIDLTLAFHRGFVEAGDNQVMLELYTQLSDRHRFILFASGERLLDRCEEIIAEHVSLVEHLRTGDSAAFATTLRGHLAENAPPTATSARSSAAFDSTMLRRGVSSPPAQQ
ncbi:MAG: GntR family transcriptional regulator [Brevibacterium sp.]|uniref:GntR family transcriptional regulator n=1 Tax=Brevibacterium sp. TaxID=1701 RepID=UPI002647F4AA|nr:GntR family transcriptional regulator [Brevibacterium sp.]MDN5806577.1 GntR family transcriptional regulator [Brevibacterium sp.]MDN5833396.1 GntR family transcriptional regulator [Brevibacterium sp.]MDN5875727.1 GntR family transcriptional regulator [Brevibacterium sp.]MDN5908505.1 GntR family transcriptional regulator [Brevibacterium sp.]MDN6132691.1 GntR family transcriptional regulator [Brevibacterium sp.]